MNTSPAEKTLPNTTAQSAPVAAAAPAQKKKRVKKVTHAPTAATPGAARGVPTKRKWRSGTVAKREIKRLSKTTDKQFPKGPFMRLVREYMQDIGFQFMVADEAVQALQEVSCC